MKTVNYRLTAWAILLLGNVTILLAQKTIPFSSKPEKNDTRLGNQEFSKGNYADAEAQYKKALDRKNNMPEAAFNLGDAVYKQKRYEETEKQFQLCAKMDCWLPSTVCAQTFLFHGSAFRPLKILLVG